MNTLKKGDKLPNFVLKDQNGIIHKSVDYAGKKLIIFFYPRANTPGCTSEVCDLRDNYEVFKEKGYHILGVSGDNQNAQMKFHKRFELPFPLLSDVDKELIKSFGVWGEKKFMGKEYEGIHRMSFIINEKGIISFVFEKVKTKDHSNQILEVI
ncbi:MAG: thioredoxin-dependent thiol peroxidase [Flavobacteriaceae bacterium]